mmetsp:Transcript_31688/g.66307  ORF Transcript_31688/g.66307 Transcript_31688/m.66307 type:complete len:231 (-) Transcript_31688:1816-2508(-)
MHGSRRSSKVRTVVAYDDACRPIALGNVLASMEVAAAAWRMVFKTASFPTGPGHPIVMDASAEASSATTAASEATAAATAPSKPTTTHRRDQNLHHDNYKTTTTTPTPTPPRPSARAPSSNPTNPSSPTNSSASATSASASPPRPAASSSASPPPPTTARTSSPPKSFGSPSPTLSTYSPIPPMGRMSASTRWSCHRGAIWWGTTRTGTRFTIRITIIRPGWRGRRTIPS